MGDANVLFLRCDTEPRIDRALAISGHIERAISLPSHTRNTGSVRESKSNSLSPAWQILGSSIDANTTEEHFTNNLLHLSPSLGRACYNIAHTHNRSVNMRVHICTRGGPLGCTTYGSA